MKYLNIVAGIVALASSASAWTSEDHYLMFGTVGVYIITFLTLLKVQHLRKHPEDKI